MAGQTTNYLFDYPTSTDYVKDGATAIETLADDVDATLFSITGGKNVGLQFISATAFSGATTATFSNIFTSAYDDYLIEISGVTAASGNPDLTIQLTIGGTPTGGSAYYYGIQFVPFSGAQGLIQSNGGASMYCGNTGTDKRDVELKISRPFLTQLKTFQMRNAASTSQIQGGGLLTTATSHDGVRLVSSSGNISGTFRVYGYRNS
jgi:hypothetical protein